MAAWIGDVQRERAALAAQLGEPTAATELTVAQVKQLVTALRNIVAVLAETQPSDKAALYKELGVTVTYEPEGTVNVQAQPRGLLVRVGGGTVPGKAGANAQVNPSLGTTPTAIRPTTSARSRLIGSS